MKRIVRAFLRILLISGGLLAAVVAVAVVLFLFAPGMCANDVIAQFSSPDGLRRVVVFERDCGATTGFSTQASILRTNEALENEAGNVFIADTDHGAAPSGPGGGPALSVDWQGEDFVRLSFDPRARVSKKESEVKGVRVSYSTIESAAQ